MTTRCSNIWPTFFHGGVQLCDLHGQPVDTVLERVGTQIEGVGLIEQFAKNILRVFAWNRMTEKEKRETLDKNGGS